jgi:hypothetical protein
MNAALSNRCYSEALFEYLVTHHEHPESMCQFPRATV